MEKLYSTSAVSVGGRDGHVKSADGLIDMELRTPGTGGKGTTPEDLFACGWAACFNGALGLVLRTNRIRAEGVTVKCTVTLGKTEEGNFQLAGEIEATIPGVEQAAAEKFVEQAHQVCPYSRATRGNVDVKLSAKIK